MIAEEDGFPVGLIDGMVTDCETIEDRLYENARLHNPKGAWQSVFGLAVRPAYRHKGVASQLMRAFIEKARKEGRRGVMLTCKEHLIGFYERFGFVKKGVSASVHGGVVWYDMVLTFQNGEGGAGYPAPKRRRSLPKSVMRSRYVHFSSIAELGTLVRTRRMRLGLNLADAAVCCGVGRRFLLNLEAGKATSRFDKVLQVLDAFGMSLALTGSGASFTQAELLDSTLENRDIVWRAEFERGLPDLPGEITDETVRRGRPIGSKRLSPTPGSATVVALRREDRDRRKIDKEGKS